MNNPLVSVIITAFSENRVKDILDIIHALKSQTYKSLEIIIVVDRKESTYKKLIKIVGDKVSKVILHKEPPGLSGARNTGVLYSTGEIVAFLDDDAIPDLRWIEEIVNAFNNYKEEDIVAVGGPIYPLWLTKKPSWLPEELYWTIGCTYKGFKNEERFVERLFGSNMAFKKNIFDTIGKFNPNFGRVDNKQLVGEETELFFRIASRGYKVLYTPRAIVYHKIFPYRAKFTYVLQRGFNYGKSIVIAKRYHRTFNNQDIYMRRYLIKVSIPERLINILKFKNPRSGLEQLGVLIATGVVIIVGMVIGALTINSTRWKDNEHVK
ncbi:glycosyltransferase family 2 protein [Thermococcus thioreducens]|uniref:Glycosyl transferase family 2 n=1 Tax=Thermococcus thioreducens TaxID=277988 RepID=A0A0Q2S2T8_9EURY|nr:glycosyltransferase [Thermococcus thioreducens]ASJ11575.1 hypothetical protein A3L14_01120 [Thermococcus thioreducens]KQH81819.1 hypothetical protein AMR53_08710 [Thermococcus thioreducens]SEW04188.1 Glycosyl transferase family 2 [Thermococcus thioreducens]